VSKTSYFKYCQLAYLSGPVCERTLYRQMAKRQPVRIVEIGLGLGVRTLRMFEVARRYSNSDEISYTGIDPFESRPADALALTMKDAYRLLRPQGVRIKLVPGRTVDATTANSLVNTDLIVIDAEVHESDLQQAWKYFPRMIHEHSLILRQTSDQRGKILEPLCAAELRRRIAEADAGFAKAA
jgi:predicted O-methyltransferase YrrM